MHSRYFLWSFACQLPVSCSFSNFLLRRKLHLICYICTNKTRSFKKVTNCVSYFEPLTSIHFCLISFHFAKSLFSCISSRQFFVHSTWESVMLIPLKLLMLLFCRVAAFRNKSIDKWQRKTQVTTGAAAIKGKLHAFNQVCLQHSISIFALGGWI